MNNANIMNNAKRNIRKYLITNGAPRLLTGDKLLWPRKNHFALSSLKRIKIVLRLEDLNGPNQGLMSLIIHSNRDFGDASNNRMMDVAKQQIPGFVPRTASNRRQVHEFGIIGKVYFPRQHTWNNLNEATLRAILDQYNVVSDALFNGGFYK